MGHKTFIYLSTKGMLLLLLFMATCELTAQRSLNKAYSSYVLGEYYLAQQGFREAMKKEANAEKRAALCYYTAECFKRMNRPTEALNWLLEAEKLGYNTPSMLYSKAELFNISTEYPDALNYYKKYWLHDLQNEEVRLRIASCFFAMNHTQTNPYNSITRLKTLNTTGSEYGLSLVNGRLIYASTGAAFEHPERLSKRKSTFDNRTGFSYSRLYQSTSDSLIESTEKPLSSLYNRKANIGTLAFDTLTQTAWFTMCSPIDGSCSLYSTYLKTNDKWSRKKRVHHGKKIISAAHPAIAKAGTRLYFVSDKPGGYGKSDIWYSDRLKNGRWATPVNAGPEINTAADELFPFLVGDSLLFFASDGHPGFGGLDIFCSRIEPDGYSTPVNLQRPFNSPFDDFNLIVEPGKTSGFLISNRQNDWFSDDIYSFTTFPNALVASGSVYNSQTGQLLPFSRIVIIENGIVTDTIFTNLNGSYSLFVSVNKNYKLVASATGYKSESTYFTTKHLYTPGNLNSRTGYQLDIKLTAESGTDSVFALNRYRIKVLTTHEQIPAQHQLFEQLKLWTGYPVSEEWKRDGTFRYYLENMIDLHTANVLINKLQALGIDASLEPMPEKNAESTWSNITQPLNYKGSSNSTTLPINKPFANE